MKWTPKYRGVKDPYQWHKWFAWYPVRAYRTWFWLETVERKKCVSKMGFTFWVYNYDE